jgi:hypothetical protein
LIDFKISLLGADVLSGTWRRSEILLIFGFQRDIQRKTGDFAQWECCGFEKRARSGRDESRVRGVRAGPVTQSVPATFGTVREWQNGSVLIDSDTF